MRMIALVFFNFFPNAKTINDFILIHFILNDFILIQNKGFIPYSY